MTHPADPTRRPHPRSPRDLTPGDAPNVPARAQHRRGLNGDEKHQTGPGTAPAARDVADPHPSDEEHPYDARQSDAAIPDDKGVGPNPARHNGKAPPPPRNAANGPD